MAVDFAQAKHVTRGIATRNSALVKFRCDCTKWKNFVTLSCNVLVMGKMGFPLKQPFRKNFMNGYGNRLTQMYFIVYCCFLFSLVRSVSFLCFVCFLSHFFFAYLFGRVVFILILSVVWLAFKLIGHVKWLKLDWSSIFHCSPPTHYKRNELSAWSHTFLSIPLDSLMSFDPQLSAVSSKSP